ncbi:MAG: hypothetical protein JNM72_00060 [Deltaproteobacteria bacterium]|nr:hypothetical protein [Deltaproteobacteria bacterium]
MTQTGHIDGEGGGRLGWAGLFAPGLAWSGLLCALSAAGLEASRPWPGVPTAWVWPLQAALGPALLPAGAALGAWMAARGPGRRPWRAAAAGFCWGFVSPLLVVDLVAWGLGGPAGLRAGAPLALGLAALGGLLGLGWGLPAGAGRGWRAVQGALVAGACVAAWAR